VKIVVHAPGAAIRGSERQVLMLIRGLVRRGHQVVVSCRGGGPVFAASTRAGARATAIRPRGTLDLVSTLLFAGWLRRERPDAVLETSWKRAYSTLLAARLARVPRAVLRLGLSQSNVRSWGPRRVLGGLADVIFVNSSGLADQLRARAPWLEPHRLHVIVNGIEATPAEPAPLRSELALGDDVRLIAAAGGLEPRKGFDVLLDALPRLRDPRTHLVLAGTGPDEAALRAQVARLGLGGRVHFLGFRSDVPAVLSASDLYVLSSRREGMAVAMLEAMGAGIPVIASDVHGTRDALAARDGRGAAGWIVPVGDAASLADAIDEVVSGVRERDQRIAARVDEARWRVENWYRPERVVSEVERLLSRPA
jgi:glycosyltransferase involved in cell wall biosynthesis